MMDLRNLRLPTTPNRYFVSPPGWGEATPDASGPVFLATSETLLDALKEVALSEPRTTLVGEDAEAGRVAFCQRSLIFRFPDDVTAQAIPAGDHRSTLAIYGKARYGHGDFGVNRRRIRRWLAALSRRLETA